MVKAFRKKSKDVISNETLIKVAKEVGQNIYGRSEAKLGAGISKKRIPRPGEGKSGGARGLIAVENINAVIYLMLRLKNEPGADFTKEQELLAIVMAKKYASLTDDELNNAVLDGTLVEIHPGAEIDSAESTQDDEMKRYEKEAL